MGVKVSHQKQREEISATWPIRHWANQVAQLADRIPTQEGFTMDLINCNKHEFHETCHSVLFYFMKKDSERCCDATTPESIHTKDESKRGSAFAFIFGVN